MFMTLLTQRPPSLKHHVVFRKCGTGLEPGQSVRVLSPLPASHWLRDVARESPDPFPAGVEIFAVDPEQEALDVAAIAEAQRAPAPIRMLTKEQLWKKCPWTRDAHLFEVATVEHGFPRAIPLTSDQVFARPTGNYCWNEQFIDRWLEQKRKDRDLYDIFLGE